MVATSHVELSAKSFSAKDVLGHPRAEVDKLLGTSTVLEDGPVLYEGFDKVPVTIMFDNGVAARISILANGLNDNAQDIDAVLRWMHTDRSQFDVEFAGMLDVWGTGMKARQQARREAAHALSDAIHSTVAANGTDLAPNCDRSTLRRLTPKLKALGIDLKALGFAMMECSGVVDDTSIPVK